VSTDTAGLEVAYLLQVRPYQETSLLIEAFGRTHGRLGLVARGARRPRSAWRSLLQPFRPLVVGFAGRGALQTLRTAESAGPVATPSGDRIVTAFYLNELLLALLRRGDPHGGLFDRYGHALVELATEADPEPALRRFELGLLQELGYGLALDHDAGGSPLDPDGRYRYVPEHGPVAVREPDAGAAPGEYSGRELLAIGRGQFADAAIRRAARQLLRAAVSHHLGDRALRTRAVLAAMRR
jgi:DNA repair protein RecO (recombination protein O)